MTFTKPFLTIWETLPCLLDLPPKGWQSYAPVEWPLFPMSVEKIHFWQVRGHVSQDASQKNAGLGCFLEPWHRFKHQKHKSDFKQVFIGKPGDRDQFPEVMLRGRWKQEKDQEPGARCFLQLSTCLQKHTRSVDVHSCSLLDECSQLRFSGWEM